MPPVALAALPAIGSLGAAASSFAISGSVAGLAVGIAEAALLAGASIGALKVGEKILGGGAPSQIAGVDFTGTQVDLVADPSYPRGWIYGRTATAGSLVYREVTGNDNEFLWLVIELADREIEAIDQVFIRGQNGLEEVVFSGTAATGRLAGLLSMYTRLGDDNSLAISELVAESLKWTNDHRGRGVSYVALKLTHDLDAYANGAPEFLFVCRGAKVYDPRKDPSKGGVGSHSFTDKSTWEYDDNAALCTLDFARGVEMNGTPIGGPGLPESLLDFDSWIAAANVCDETITNKDLTTSKRYTCNGYASTQDPDKTATLEALLLTMAARPTLAGVKFGIEPAAARASGGFTLDDDDLAGPIRFQPTRSIQDKANAIAGKFRDPNNNYEVVDYPPLRDAAAQAQDRGQFVQRSLDFAFVDDHRACQRISKVILGFEREQMEITAVWRPKAHQLAAWRTFDWVSAHYGENRKCRAAEFSRSQTGLVEILIRSESDDKYAWIASTDEQDMAAVNTLPRPSSVPGIGVADDTKAVNNVPAATVQDNADRGGNLAHSSLDGVLKSNIRIDQGDNVERLLARTLSFGTVRHNQARTFEDNFVTLPGVRIINAMTYNGSVLSGTTSHAPFYNATNQTISGYFAQVLLRERSGATTFHQDQNPTAHGSTPIRRIQKTQASEAFDDKYKYRFDLTFKSQLIDGQVSEATASVELYTNDGGGWVLRATQFYNVQSLASQSFIDQEKVITVDGLGQHAGEEFGLDVTVSDGVFEALTLDFVQYTTAVAPAALSATPSGVPDALTELLDGEQIP